MTYTPSDLATEDSWVTGTASANGVTYAVGTVVANRGVRWLDGRGGTSATAPSADTSGRWISLTTSAAVAPPPRYRTPLGPTRKIVQDFESHAWTASGTGGSTNLTSTTNPAPGHSQNVRIVTNGASGQRLLRTTGITAIDMTGRLHSIYIYVTNAAHLLQLSIEFGDTAFTNFYRTYVQSTVVGSNSGWIPEATWVQVDLPWHIDSTTGAPNRAALTCLQVTVIDDNTSNPVTVDIQDFASIPQSTVFNHGVVVADLDDGFQSHWDYARPLLSSLGFAANVFPICETIDTAGRLTTAQLQALQNEYGWCIGTHAFTSATHAAAGGLPSLTPAQVDTDLRSARAFNAVRGLAADHFAYPHGQFDGPTKAKAAEYFLSSRTVTLTREVIPATDQMRVRALAFIASSSLPGFEAAVDDAYTNGYMLRIINHNIVTSGATGDDVTQANYAAFWNYVAAKGIPVMTVPQLFAAAT